MRRALPLAAGSLLLLLVWGGAVPAEAPGPFSSHMIVHVTVMALAAPLLAFALAGSSADPAARLAPLAAPIPAMLLELAVVWGWHVPTLHMAAQASAAIYLAEQASFLGVGLLLWLSVLGGAARNERLGVGVLALLMTSMHMTLLGTLITLAPRVLFASAGCLSTSPLADQQVAGMIMLLGGATSYLAGGLYLMQRLLRESPGRA